MLGMKKPFTPITAIDSVINARFNGLCGHAYTNNLLQSYAALVYSVPLLNFQPQK